MKFDLTLLKSGKALTKVYTDPSKKPEPVNFGSGEAQKLTLDFVQYVDLLASLKPNQALLYGIARNGNELNSVTVKDDQEGQAAGKITRSRECFTWSKAAGVWYIDLDGQIDDDALQEARAAIYAAMPLIERAPHAVTRSSSHGVVIDGKVKQGGAHIYVLVDDASKIPELTNTLYTRLFNAGFGYHILNRSKVSPAALERNLIDKAVSQPERIDFAAAPVIKCKGMMRRTTAPIVANAYARPLESDLVKPLTSEEIEQYRELAAASKQRVKPELRKEKARLLKATPKAERKQAYKAMQAAGGGKLAEWLNLYLDDGSVVTVKEILFNRKKYHGKACRDPLEPDYRDGSITAIIYCDQETPVVHSQAHGGQTFTLGLACFKTLMDYVRSVGVLNVDLEKAAEVSGFSVKDAQRILLKQGMKKYKPLHQAAPAELVFTSFKECMDHLEMTGTNAVVQAQLGSGKTEAVKQLVDHYRNHGDPVFISTVLTALAKQNAERSHVVDYQEPAEWITASGSVSTTIHSAALEKVGAILDEMVSRRSGLVVVDEANQVADLLFNPDNSTSNILPGTARRQIIDKLWKCSRLPGVQIIALDGDVSMGVASFAQSFGLEVVKVTECRYPQPAVVVYPVKKFEDLPETEPLDKQVKESLQAGQKTVIASTSKNLAANLFAKYVGLSKGASLLITSETKDQPEVVAFLEDPEAGAVNYDFVVYSPVLSAGFSIVKTPVKLFAFTDYPTVSVNGFWQMMRRFRQPLDGVIHCSLGTMSQRATAAWVPESEIDFETIELANRFYGGRTYDPLDSGQNAYLKQRNLTAQNFSEAFLFHLLNSGVNVSVSQVNEIPCATQSLKTYNKARKEQRKLEVCSSEVIDDATANELSFQSGTPENAIKLERFKIEQGLMLTSDDHETNGNLPGAIYDEVVEGNLLGRVKRDALHKAFLQGVDFSDELTSSFALKATTDKQIKVLDAIAQELASDDALVFTAARAAEIADKYRAEIHARYDLMSKPPVKPRRTSKEAQAAYRRKANSWLKNLLTSWGYEISSRKPEKEWIYTAQKSALVGRFSARFLSSNCFTTQTAGSLAPQGLEPATSVDLPLREISCSSEDFEALD